MSKPSIFRDVAGNIRELNASKLLASSANCSVSTVLAGVAAVTLQASTGNAWVLDYARLSICSLAASTSVVATIYDGTTVLHAQSFSASGVYDLVAEGIDKVSIKGAGSAALGVTVSTGGTSSITSLAIRGHKVVSADI